MANHFRLIFDFINKQKYNEKDDLIINCTYRVIFYSIADGKVLKNGQAKSNSNLRAFHFTRKIFILFFFFILFCFPLRFAFFLSLLISLIFFLINFNT